MKRKILLLLIILILPFNCFALEYPKLHYKSAIIYDLTDEKVLYELQSNEQMSIASLTKLMTIITAIEKNKDYSKKIIYDQNMKNNVAWYASVAGFKVGDVLTFDDLLYGAMLPSGADATVALAITTSGSLEKFVVEMNTLAKKIGMTNSNFQNVHGLDAENHYSTAEDIRKLLAYSLKNDKFREVYTTKEYTLSTGKKIKSTVKRQADAFNIDISKIKGSKTGFTGNAGFCISALVTHEEHEIIIITLNAPENSQGVSYNLSDTLDLIKFIETNYHKAILVKKDKLIKVIPVNNSKQDTYKITASNNIEAFLEKDYDKDKLKITYSGLKELSYKNKVNTTIGKIKYYYDNKLITEEQVKLNTKLELSVLKLIKSNIIIFITILLAIAFSIFLFKGKKQLNSN